VPDGRAGVVQYYAGRPRAHVRLTDAEIINGVKPQEMTQVQPKPVDPASPWVGVDLEQ
jgi:hypothetical protein